MSGFGTSGGTVTIGAGDIEIGAVELKNATDDTRAIITGAGALKTDGSGVTQPVSAAALPLPTGASTEATLALIKAKTDNLDVALSTVATQATLALIKAKTDNLDAALSTLATQVTLNFLRPHPTEDSTLQDLSAGPLDVSTAQVADFRLSRVTLHSDAAITQTVQVILTSVLGAAYSVVLASVNLVAATDFVYQPDAPLNLLVGNQIRVTCTDTGSPAANVGVVIGMEPI